MIQPDLTMFPGARAVPGYDDLYAMPDGRIVSTRWGRPHVRRQCTVRGHRRVPVIPKRGSKREAARVHQLIALAFCGPRPSPEHSALHRNGIAADNRAENVFWGTKAELIAIQIGKQKHVRGRDHGRVKLTEEQVLEIRTRYVRGASGYDLANRYGVSKGNIFHILHRRSWKHLNAESK